VQERTAELEAIFASLPDALYVGNTNGIYRCNQKALDRLGCASIEELWDKIPVLAEKLRNRYVDTGQRIPAEEEPFVRALQGEPAVLEMIQRNVRTGQDAIIRSACAPILQDGKVLGAVAINSDITERVRNEQLVRQQSERLAILHEIDNAVLAARAPVEIAQAALERVLRATEASQVAVALYHRAGREAEILATAGVGSQGYTAGARLPLSVYPMIDLVNDGRAATVEDFAALPDGWPAKETTLAAGIRSACLVPLRLGDAVIGVLTVGRSAAGPLPPEIMDLMAHVADSLAVAIYNARLHQDLEVSREELRALSRRLVDVHERERRVVADQLFNQVSQVLAALQLQLGTLRPAVRCEPEATRRLNESQETIDGLLRELHTLATDLRPVSLDRLGLVAALGQYVAEFGQTHGMTADFAAVNLEGLRIPAEVETGLFRIAQEALGNAEQHSAATRVAVILNRRERRLALTIEDNGLGFDLGKLNPQRALGLAAMRERAESLGGSLTVETAPACGTAVLVEVPF
jgi:signal transduction histidine kinase